MEVHVCCGFSPTAVWPPTNVLATRSTRLANRLAPRCPNVAFPPFGPARGLARHQSVRLARLVTAAPVCHHHELSSIRSRTVLRFAVPSTGSIHGWHSLACPGSPGCFALTPPHELSNTLCAPSRTIARLMRHGCASIKHQKERDRTQTHRQAPSSPPATVPRGDLDSPNKLQAAFG